MLRLSCIDAISPAWARLVAMLFRPFRFSAWLKIGFIGWLAGAASTASYNFSYGGPSMPGKVGGAGAKALDKLLRAFFREHLLAIVILAAVGLGVFLVFTYLFCRFRFILFDTVLEGSAEIARGWNHYGRPAQQYFGFWIIFSLLSWAALFWIVGLPLWRAFQGGILQSQDPLSAFFRLLAPILLGVLAFAIVSGIISTLANDFLVPQMALDGVRIGDAWANLMRMIAKEPGAFAGYLGMKFLLSIAAAIAVAIPLFLGFLILLIPGIIAVLLAVALVKSMGSAGFIVGIGLAGVGVLVLIALGLVAMLLAGAPVAVFFTAYALQFFGGRYPKLGERLWLPPAAGPPSPYLGGTPPPPMPAV